MYEYYINFIIENKQCIRNKKTKREQIVNE